MTLAELLGPANVTMGAIAGHLDGLTGDERTAQCLALTPPQQKKLWHLASQSPANPQPLLGEDGQAIFVGRNTLQLFTRFEKRFARVGDAVFGYNRHRLSPIIGPGYFTVVSKPAALMFDYANVPASSPNEWPRVRANTRGLAKAVYGGLIDDVVWVARDVLIGSARRGDAPLDSYFVLARS